MNISKFYHLFLDWKRKGKCDNPSKKELLRGLTFVYRSCLSLLSKLNSRFLNLLRIILNAICPSSLAKAAPKQKWIPVPKPK